ncbi:hypothetical protein PAMC26577_37945 [Caballeronia sordidicola]|uniref:Uncharacterized protein n=1 Tax=Caballeronia sordidicola TaxID=196367 RepID=A0A242M5K0_CABSO|nr:hypothetical protein PAMC26577_37945 [Caballeronia sordidicola]
MDVVLVVRNCVEESYSDGQRGQIFSSFEFGVGCAKNASFN